MPKGASPSGLPLLAWSPSCMFCSHIEHLSIWWDYRFYARKVIASNHQNLLIERIRLSMKRKVPNTEPPRPLTEAEKDNLRKDMQESSKWARKELKNRKEVRASSSDQLKQDGPRPLTPKEIEDLRQDMKDASAKMKEVLEKRYSSKPRRN